MMLRRQETPPDTGQLSLEDATVDDLRVIASSLLTEHGMNPVRPTNKLRWRASPWEKVMKTEDCWYWVGALNAYGYGVFTLRGQPWMAHRYFYEHLVGPIPEGLDIDHLCRVRACVNPAHLEPVTRRENLLRGEGRTARNAAVKHCPQNHAYDSANTYISRKGSRECRACKREKARLLRHPELQGLFELRERRS